MATTSDDRNQPANFEGEDGGKAPEEATLLGAQVQPPRDGVANVDPGAESSSPLLARPDEDADPTSTKDKVKRNKRKKLRESLASGSTGAQRSKSKKRAPADKASKKRDSTTRNDGRGHDREVSGRDPRQPPTARPLWGWLSRCVCIKGSLQPPPSITELPELSSSARASVKTLDKVTKKSNVEVYVRHTDNMPFLSNSISTYGHPIVVIHFVDLCTGLPLAPSQHTGQATFRPSMLNAFEWRSSNVCRSLTLAEFLLPHVLMLMEIVEPRRRKAHKQQERNITTGSKTTSKNLDHDLSSEAFYKRVAWCFFRPISNSGNIRLPSLSLPGQATAREESLRLQLFAWHPLGWLDTYQARSQFRWNPDSGEGVPSVFLQFQRRTKSRLLCSLHVEIRPVASSQSPKRLIGISQSAPQSATVTNEPVSGNNQDETTESSNGIELIAPATVPAPDPLLHCKRHAGELCLVPQRVLYRLPTGRKGCSCLVFSPDGLFLAAAIHHLTSTAEEWVIHIHEINTGTLWQSCRGHQSMIYSLEWGVAADGATKTLVSASSDGSAILWLLRGVSGTIDRRKSSAVVPTQVLQHVPSPVFVYCAVFHPRHPQLVVTGASDGVIRLWDVRGASDTSTTKPARTYLSTPIHEWRISPQGAPVAIHSIRMETRQGGRLFCGDASGTITVWSPTNLESMRYELTKTVRTGQRRVASLALHPRKQHLLVMTHPHALFQYETRSFLLLHKSYSGIECDQLLTKAAFSPDGQYVVSGSEDGVPHLFGAVEGVRLEASSGGLWGHRFFHGFPLMEIAWSPSAHIVAMGAYGEHHPIVVLSANREDRSLLEASGGSRGMHKQILDRAHVDGGLGSLHRDLRNPVGQVDDSAVREATERVWQRRQQRLQAKLARELEAAEPQQHARDPMS